MLKRISSNLNVFIHTEFFRIVWIDDLMFCRLSKQCYFLFSFVLVWNQYSSANIDFCRFSWNAKSQDKHKFSNKILRDFNHLYSGFREKLFIWIHDVIPTQRMCLWFTMIFIEIEKLGFMWKGELIIWSWSTRNIWQKEYFKN